MYRPRLYPSRLQRTTSETSDSSVGFSDLHPRSSRFTEICAWDVRAGTTRDFFNRVAAEIVPLKGVDFNLTL